MKSGISYRLTPSYFYFNMKQLIVKFYPVAWAKFCNEELKIQVHKMMKTEEFYVVG
jgi:peroxiredoxin